MQWYDIQMKPKLILGLALVLGGGLFGCSSNEHVSVENIKIAFTTPTVTSPRTLPREALYPQGAEDGREYGALTNIVAGHIAALTVTWADPKIFKTENQTRDFLKELLSSTNENNWTFHAWSYVDTEPSMVTVVEHTAGRQGKWLIWCSPNVAWAYQDENGKWWWGLWDALKTPRPKSLNAAK
jgi:hypothetical protein